MEEKHSTENGGRAESRNGGRRVTAFYIEALILVALLTMVVLVLTWIFAWSGQRSKKAALLTAAVHLAENGAEAVASSESIEEVRELLEENGNAEISGQATEDGSSLRLYYDNDLKPAPEGSIWLDILWMPEDGGFVKSILTVEQAGGSEPIYTLETGVFIGKEEDE